MRIDITEIVETILVKVENYIPFVNKTLMMEIKSICNVKKMNRQN